MSLPRQVLAGGLYLVTRRCTQRQFLMRPDPVVNNAFIYCLAEAARLHGVQILFTVAMANHAHTGIHDPGGSYPAFIEHFHKLFAKCMNAYRGRRENFWSSQQTSIVRMVDPNDALAKLVYVVANPVAAGLVARASQWPGVSSYNANVGGHALIARRPTYFFRSDGSMPSTATLRFERIPGFENLDTREYRKMLVSLVEEREKELARVRAQKGSGVLGVKGVLAQDWRAQPKTAESTQGLSPTFAARNKRSRILALLQRRDFVNAYRQAREAFIAGIRDVVFPVGTWWLRRFAGAKCDSLQSAA